LLVVFSYRFWLAALGGYLVRSDPPAHADMIVVLGGDFFGNRILKAGELVRQGFASQALVSGTGDVYGLYEPDLEIAFAVRHGYPKSYFVSFPIEARSTQTEADQVVSELRQRHMRQIDIVTSNYHTRRAGRIFRSKAPDLEIHMIAAPDRDFTPDGWWKTREGQKVFLDEWMKTVARWFGL
jgi:uncharacterized SAM-binding protein YcdF (DUF218 family)